MLFNLIIDIFIVFRCSAAGEYYFASFMIEDANATISVSARWDSNPTMPSISAATYDQYRCPD